MSIATSAVTAAGLRPSIGRYRLTARLGGGTTSEVHEALDETTGGLVAVKSLAAELADEPETRERFLREARVTAGLRHPNIVSVLEVGDDHGQPYIVMERLQGVQLAAYLRQDDARTLEARLSLIGQLLDGLEAAHARGVVHRDIKPGNIIIEPGGRLKILDFGLARLDASTLTAHGQVVGTPDFMSPEQARGRQVDHRSDIFSAAAVGYLILTGRRPFTGSTLREILHALLNGMPPPITDTEAPSAVAAVFHKALAKSPQDRYPTCAAMRAALQHPRGQVQPFTVWRRLAAYVGVIRS